MFEFDKVSLRKFDLPVGVWVIDTNGEEGWITRRPYTTFLFGTRVDVDYNYMEDSVSPHMLTLL